MFHFGDPPATGEWFARVLMRARLSPLASESYLAEHGRPTSLADLARHRLLGWRIGRADPYKWPLSSGGALDVSPIFSSRNGQLLHQMAQAGMGILLGNPDPSMLIHPIPLVPVLADEVGAELTMRCLSPVPAHTDPRSRAVLESIQTFLHNVAPAA